MTIKPQPKSLDMCGPTYRMVSWRLVADPYGRVSSGLEEECS